MQKSTRKPVIGILGNILETESGAWKVKRAFTNDACVRSIAANGGIPVILPLTSGPAAVGLCDGLLFPGGLDVDPAFYGEPPHAGLGEVDHALDVFWLDAARQARERRIPVLGICRGAQLLNVAWGGSLYQDLGEREATGERHLQAEAREVPTHAVQIEPGSRLGRILGVTAVRVNSLHHQAVKKLGEGLTASAHAEDGLIEGLESPDGLAVAVQWHPEDLIESVPVMNRLFADLAERADHRPPIESGWA